MKTLPPYGRRLAVPRQTGIVMLYVGAPECWQAAADDQHAGLFNHLVLPSIYEARRYKWPLTDCIVSAIDFGMSEEAEIRGLIITLAGAGVSEVSVRQMYNDQVTCYIRGAQKVSA